MQATPRDVPLVVIGAVDREAAGSVAALFRAEGAVVLVAQGDRTCLRVATSARPDVVLLDPRLSRGLLGLLRAHPFLRGAHIGWSGALAGPWVAPPVRVPPGQR